MVNRENIVSGCPDLDNIISLKDSNAREIIKKRQKKYLMKAEENINFLSLIVAEHCNLSCSYCIASLNMKAAMKIKTVLMPWHIAKKGLDWYLKLPHLSKELYINISGGEPLINKDVVKKSIEYIRTNYKDRNIKITINTNATLIDEQFAKFFTSNQVEIATSLDGTPQISDIVRQTRRGLPASPKILQGWKLLEFAGSKLNGFMSTYDDRNINYLNNEIIDFTEKMGFTWLRISCDVIHLLTHPISDTIERIWSVYKYGKDRGITVEGYWSTAMNNLVSKNYKPNGASFFCGAVSGETVSLHPDGRLSSCGYSTGNFGNILNDNPFNFIKHRSYIRRYFPGSRKECLGCEIEGACAGGCDISREVACLLKDDTIIKYNCTMYKELTRRLLIDHFQ